MCRTTKAAVVLALFCVFSIGYVAATGTQEQKLPSDAAEIRIVWEALDSNKLQGWQQYILRPFEKKFPNIKVKFEPIPNQRDTIRVQVSSGSGPDIFHGEIADIANYARAGASLNLDKYVKKFGWEKIIYDYALDTCKVKGQVYGIPQAYEVTLLSYNKDMLDANGWLPPKTRSDFERICSDAMSQHVIPIPYGNMGVPILSVWPIERYMNAYAGKQAQKDLFGRKIKFTDAPIRDAFELLKKDWDKGWWGNRNSAAISAEEARTQYFFGGKSPFNHEGTWIYYTGAKIPFNWYATKWPSMRDGIPPIADLSIGAAFIVLGETKHPDAAAEFLNFLYTEEKLLAEGVGRAMTEMIARPINPVLFPQDGDPQIKKLLKIMDEVKEGGLGYAPWCHYPNLVMEYTAQNLDKVLYDQMTLEAYLQEAQRLLEEEFQLGWEFAGK